MPRKLSQHNTLFWLYFRVITQFNWNIGLNYTGDRVVYCLGLRSLDCCDCGFELLSGQNSRLLGFPVWCAGIRLCDKLITSSKGTYRARARARVCVCVCVCLIVCDLATLKEVTWARFELLWHNKKNELNSVCFQKFNILLQQDLKIVILNTIIISSINYYLWRNSYITVCTSNQGTQPHC